MKLRSLLLTLSLLASVSFGGFFPVNAQTVDLSTGLTISAVVNAPGTPGGGGGGGGGGGFPGPTTIVNFSGRAYPLSRVSILQDGALAVSTIAGPDARFAVSFTSVTAGSYTFTVYGEDSAGRRSENFSFPLIIRSGTTVDVSGIFISPTIDVDKSEVRQGDNLIIFGQSLPESTVVISVHSEFESFHSVETDAVGAYVYTLDTSPLEIGGHEAKAKAVLPGEASEYGRPVQFIVGDKNVDAVKYCGAGRGDLNCDYKVNIVDYSILAFWYNKRNPPAKVDLNADKKVNLVDFSILAYYWTG